MTQITATAYEPGDDLRELLKVFEGKTTIEYGDESTTELSNDMEAHRREYRIVFDEFEASGYETTSELGLFLSIEGNFGLAAALILTHALQLGVPTQTYTDEAPPPPPAPPAERYQDVTAEWYPQTAVRAGLPDARMSQRMDSLEAEELGLGELERWARVWLSRDSQPDNPSQ